MTAGPHLVDDAPRSPSSQSGSGEEDGDKEDDADDDDESKSTPKGRKKIRKILKDDKLRSETQNALKEEEERRKRIAEREQLREKLREVSGANTYALVGPQVLEDT